MTAAKPHRHPGAPGCRLTCAEMGNEQRKRPAKYRCTGCDFFGVIFLNRGWLGELVVEPILPAHRCLGGKVTEFCCCGTAPYAAALAGADGTTAWAVVF